MKELEGSRVEPCELSESQSDARPAGFLNKHEKVQEVLQRYMMSREQRFDMSKDVENIL